MLDTWFSSALWPFSTMGWPEKTPELARYYPTSVLVTGYDIIFFWVARMMFTGIEFMQEVPFGICRSSAWSAILKGEKCRSRSATASIRTVDRQFGADTLRFTLVTGNTPDDRNRGLWSG